MVITTRIFGEITVDDTKVITFQNGIVGFPKLQRFLLIHDEEKGDKGGIRWLQSLEEPQFAMLVVDPLTIVESYNPKIEDELLKVIDITDNSELLVLTTMTIPHEIEKMTINLMAPIIINVDNQLACQMIVEGDYLVKYPVYEILEERKSRKDGE
ncbi:MAG: flagellar assembly protein FliW [Eubacteriales bacterium]